MQPDDPVLAPAPPSWRDRWDELVARLPVDRPGPLVGAAVVAVVVVVLGWLLLRPSDGSAHDVVLPEAGTAAEPAPPAAFDVVAHAAGAVVEPGVYRLPDGSRVGDLVAAAGGPTPDADLDRVNLAAALTDGVRVYVPRVGEPVAGPDAADTVGDLVSLSAASAAQLEALPGIGPATAAAIIAYRDEHGPFRSVDQLLDVRGIGPAKLEQLRDLVTP